MIVNPSLAAFLLPEGQRPRCISVSYDRTTGRKGEELPADIKSFKTFDTTIAKGDFVVIPTDTRWGFTVGRVEDVDLVVNFNSQETMRWVASKVDKAAYDSIAEREKVLTAAVSKATAEKARRELSAELQAIDPNLVRMSLIGNGPVEAAPQPEPSARGGAQRGGITLPTTRSPNDDNDLF